jgi:hypothetical protein
VNGATTVVGGPAIVDAAAHAWTLRADRATLRDGVHVGVGYADLLLWWNGEVYAQAVGSWFRFSVTMWMPLGAADPRGTGSPTPQPPAVAPAPVITARPCPVYVDAPKPASAAGTGWKVQYFDGSTALTTPSATVKRSVTLSLGSHRITAEWTKIGQPTIPTAATTRVCQ